MSSATNRQPTGELYQRKVGHIYDALDARTYKTAIKLCDAALSKHADSDLLAVLKAMALGRGGKQLEAGKVLDELMGRSWPLDDATQRVLKMVLKDLRRMADLVLLYERALQDDPGSEDVLMGLFHAYAREGRYQQHQQVAMKLVRVRSNTDSAQWCAITACVLQARALLQPRHAPRSTSSSAVAPSSVTPQQLLQLAETMAGRAAARQGRLPSFEALLLWIDLLLAGGRTAQAADLLASPMGQKVVAQAEERAALAVDLAAAQGDLGGAAQQLHARLMQVPDDCVALRAYMDCQLPTTAATPLPHASSLLWLEGGLAQLMQPQSHPARAETPFPSPGLQLSVVHPAAASTQAAIQQCQETVMQLVQAAGPLSAGSKPAQGQGQVVTLQVRGPHLAQVHLAARQLTLAQQQHGSDLLVCAASQSLAAAMASYVQEAGHLASCAADLRQFGLRLDEPSAAWLADLVQQGAGTALQSSVVDNGVVKKASAESVRRLVCAARVAANLGHPSLLDVSAAERYARELMAQYSACQHLYKGLDEREPGPADALPPLAAAALVQAACHAPTHNQAALLLGAAVALLEVAVVGRPYASAIRLALAALHTLLGSSEATNTHLRALSIKNIQLDSLGGQHLLPALLAFAPPPATPAALAPPAQAEGLGMVACALRETAALFHDHVRDGGDMLELAYMNGTYTKVLEFAAFSERLAASHTRAVMRAEQVMLAARSAVWGSGTAPGPAPGTLCTTLAGGLAAGLSAHPLPWSHAPTAAHLRFNEDLGTRPGWYPPQGVALALAPAAWWAGRADAECAARGLCAWWHEPGAAESSHPAATALRAAQTAAVRGRWCQAHALSGVLRALGAVAQLGRANSNNDTGSTDQLPFDAAVQQLAVSLGAPEDLQKTTDSICGWVLGETAGREGSTRGVQLLSCGVLACLGGWGDAIVAVASTSTATGAPVQQQGAEALSASAMEASVSLLVTLLPTAVSALSAQLLEGGATAPVLPGGLLASWGVLIGEPLTWLVAALEVGAQAVKLARTKSKKGKPALIPEGAEEKVEALGASLGRVREVVVEVLGAAAAALKPLGERLAAQGRDAPGLLVSLAQGIADAAGGGVTREEVGRSWSWQGSSASAERGLGQVVRAQHAVVARLSSQLAYMVKSCAAKAT